MFVKNTRRAFAAWKLQNFKCILNIFKQNSSVHHECYKNSKIVIIKIIILLSKAFTLHFFNIFNKKPIVYELLLFEVEKACKHFKNYSSQ